MKQYHLVIRDANGVYHREECGEDVSHNIEYYEDYHSVYVHDKFGDAHRQRAVVVNVFSVGE
jgi:3-phosphoglycerate kinase